MSWQFFVNHFQNETQARRDNKYTYRLNNGSFYVGLDPPSDAEPYVTIQILMWNLLTVQDWESSTPVVTLLVVPRRLMP